MNSIENFNDTVTSAANALAYGKDHGEVVAHLVTRDSLTVEQAHLLARAGEVYLKLNEKDFGL
jgi:hypothetical protein